MVKKIVITWAFGDDFDHVEFLKEMITRVDAYKIESIMIGAGDSTIEMEDIDMVEADE